MNIKLFETNNDAIIRVLGEKIQLAEHENKTLRTYNDMLQRELDYYREIYKNLKDYKQFIQFRNKLDELLETDVIDIEDIKYEWKEAYRNGDLEKMEDLFNKMIKYQSPELLSTIQELKEEIGELEAEIDELEQEY